MKLSKALSILLLCGWAILSAGIHDNAGSYGYQFLNISSDPVNLALGGRGIHASMDHNAFARQPAIGSVNSHRTLGASYLAWLDDTGYNNLYYSYSNIRSHFGINLRNLDYGSIEKRDDTGALIGYYHPSDLSLMANYAMRLSPSSYLGFNGGIMYQKIATASAIGFHTDLGYTWLPPVTDMHLSMAVRNLGISSKMDAAAPKLPISLEVDMGKKWDFEQVDLTLELGGIKTVDTDIKGVVGVQVGVMQMLSLRGAYKINYESQNLSAGIGIKINKLDLNYGWAGFQDGLNDVHSFGVAWRF